MILRLLKTTICLFAVSVTLHAGAAEKELTAHRAAGEFEQLDLENLPAWDKDVYKERFKEIRDKKFLSYDGEERRIPWLYARDGCHMRSTQFILESKRLGYEEPKKVFIFGSLEMKGVTIPYGSVEPWFHAAPIVKVDGEAMVLDPSVSFTKPLPLETWVDLIAKDKSKIIYSICEPGTYMHTSKCNNPDPLNVERLEKETQLFLKFEKNILRNLGLSFN